MSKEVEQFFDGAFSGRLETDFAGGVFPFRVVIEDSDWNKPQYLPTGEKQSLNGRDKLNCVTQSNHNDLEIQLNQQIADKTMPVGHLEWLNKKGYIDENGKVNFSEKFNSILNKTAEYKGNWLYNVAEDGRKNGMIPQSLLPERVGETWEQYYDKSQITEEMLALGKEFLTYFEIPYEWVNDTSIENLKKQLQQAPLQVVNPGHAIVEIRNEGDLMKYFDSYEPYVKSLTQSRITDFMKIIINPININSMANVKVIKDANSSAVGFWLPAISPECLEGMALNYGLTVPKLANGEVDWDKLIQGTLTLK